MYGNRKHSSTENVAAWWHVAYLLLFVFFTGDFTKLVMRSRSPLPFRSHYIRAFIKANARYFLCWFFLSEIQSSFTQRKRSPASKYHIHSIESSLISFTLAHNAQSFYKCCSNTRLIRMAILLLATSELTRHIPESQTVLVRFWERRDVDNLSSNGMQAFVVYAKRSWWYFLYVTTFVTICWRQMWNSILSLNISVPPSSLRTK